MREDQHGRYYGVGMTIQPQLVDGMVKIFVLFANPGTPANRAGIRPGDMIVSRLMASRQMAWIQPQSLPC